MSSTKQLISRLSLNTTYLSLISAVGLLLSIYTLYVEIKYQNNKQYRALCDLNPHISCTQVFDSKYGKGFGILGPPFDLPNPVFGSIFYLIQLAIANFSHSNLLLTKIYIFNAIISNIGSVYLAYILVFVLRNLCVVCASIYVVNFVMLLVGINRYRIITSFKRYKKD